LALPEVVPGFEWVFDDPDTIAVEKLDGSNVKLLTECGRLLAVQNRKNIIDLLQVIKGQSHYMEGVFQAIGKGYVRSDGEQAGELIGPKIQGNPYRLRTHLWYPFDKAIKHLSYRAFHEHPKTFENISFWFKDWLPSRFYLKRVRRDDPDYHPTPAEGVVFYNLKRKADCRPWRAKLRRNMFPWYYGKLRIEGLEE
jgi:hypothetical protein